MHLVVGRRAAAAAFAALFAAPNRTPADTAIPAFSLKGIPGLTPAEKPRPVSELGVIGRGQDNDKSGRLNFCDRKGCISTFSSPYDDSFVPPWTYDTGYECASACDAAHFNSLGPAPRTQWRAARPPVQVGRSIILRVWEERAAGLEGRWRAQARQDPRGAAMR